MAETTTSTTTSVYSKDNPFPGLVRENRLLSKPGSAKETRHFVVDIVGSGLVYKVGDSLGIFAMNRPADVDEIIGRLGASGDESVTLPRSDESVTLREALEARVALAGPTRKTLELLAAKTTDSAEKNRLEDLLRPESKEIMMAYLAEREYPDLLAEFPSARIEPAELVGQMRKLMPRLYSIASSPKWFPEEVHLTVATVRYTTNNRERAGVCSTFLADRVDLNKTPVPVFIASSHFNVPEDGTRDIIMIGPGTGIAPFRAFVQERISTAATGRNWLFFGDQRRATDFLYEDEWSGFMKDGALHRLDTAFSRDQENKIYVQDRMMENAAEIWKWLKGGAFFYVCGDAKRMAKDVDSALHRIAAEQGDLDEAGARDFVKALKKEKRYQRDVY